MPSSCPYLNDYVWHKPVRAVSQTFWRKIPCVGVRSQGHSTSNTRRTLSQHLDSTSPLTAHGNRGTECQEVERSLKTVPHIYLSGSQTQAASAMSHSVASRAMHYLSHHQIFAIGSTKAKSCRSRRHGVFRTSFQVSTRYNGCLSVPPFAHQGRREHGGAMCRGTSPSTPSPCRLAS